MALIFCVLLTSVIKPSCLRITYSMEYRQNLSVMDCIVHTCMESMFSTMGLLLNGQEAQVSPRDRAIRRVN